jgi:Protein of unknown function (DUF1036)
MKAFKSLAVMNTLLLTIAIFLGLLSKEAKAELQYVYRYVCNPVQGCGFTWVWEETNDRQQEREQPRQQGHYLRFTNNCSHPVKIAVHYRDVSNKWITDGWWRFSPGDNKFLAIGNSRLVSNNRIFYFYAETIDSSNSLTWKGENYALIDGKQYGFRKVHDTRGNNNDFSVQCK